MKRAQFLSIAPLLLLVACQSQSLTTPMQGTSQQIPAVAVNDSCSSHTTEADCKGSLSLCAWTPIAACPSGATCPAGVCVSPDPCADLPTAAACQADANCAWSTVAGTTAVPALCPVGQTCDGGGFCFERGPSGNGCLCVQPLACPANGSCPPVQCDCPPPPATDGGSAGGGGTCTCDCPPCPAGEVCPVCDCACGQPGGGCGGGAAGSTGSGGATERRRDGDWRRNRDLHLQLPRMPGRPGLPGVQLRVQQRRDHDHDGSLCGRWWVVGDRDQHRQRRLGARGRLRLSGLSGRRGLRAVRLRHDAAGRSLHRAHGRHLLHRRHCRRVRLDLAQHRVHHHAVPDRDLCAGEAPPTGGRGQWLRRWLRLRLPSLCPRRGLPPLRLQLLSDPADPGVVTAGHAAAATRRRPRAGRRGFGRRGVDRAVAEAKIAARGARRH